MHEQFCCAAARHVNACSCRRGRATANFGDLVKQEVGRYTGSTMPEPSDPEEWAKRYLDLWQDQVSAMARDPEVLKNLLIPFMSLAVDGPAKSGNGPAAVTDPALVEQVAKAWLAGFMGRRQDTEAGFSAHRTSSDRSPEGKGDDGQDESARANSAATGPEAATAASDNDDGNLVALSRRIAGLEERIARLESAQRGGTGKPGKGGRKAGARKTGSRPRR
jgi:hypothetical protein